MKIRASILLALAGVWTAPQDAHGSLHVKCKDLPDWSDSYDYRCVHYEESEYCTPDGQPGAGWLEEWGSISDWKKENGKDAVEACCACGGGVRPRKKPKDVDPKIAKRRELGGDAPRQKGKGGRKDTGKGAMTNKEWKRKVGETKGEYGPGWTFAGRVPALPPRHAPYELVSKGGTMVCHMTKDELASIPKDTPFFIHTAKTGGRALIRYLQTVLGEKYCEDWIYLHVNPTFKPPTDSNKPTLDGDCRSKLESYISNLQAFTVIRDPLERLVSELGHSRVLPNIKAAYGTLEQHFSAMYKRRWYTNFQTGVLAGYRVCNGDSVVGASQLEHVKELIRSGKLLVGITEDMEASLSNIFSELEAKRPEVIRQSFDTIEKKPKTNGVPELVTRLRSGATPQLKKQFEEFKRLHALDYELYDFVKEHLKSKYEHGDL